MSDPVAHDTAAPAEQEATTAPPRPAPVPVWYFPALGLALGLFSLTQSLGPSALRAVTILPMLIAIRLLDVAYRRVTGTKPPLSVAGVSSWLSVAWLVVTVGLLVESYLLTLHHGAPWYAIAGSALIALATVGYGWLISDPEEPVAPTSPR